MRDFKGQGTYFQLPPALFKPKLAINMSLK